MMSNENIQEYHFAGTGLHAPITIKATSPDEAKQKYDQLIGVKIVKSEYETPPEIE